LIIFLSQNKIIIQKIHSFKLIYPVLVKLLLFQRRFEPEKKSSSTYLIHEVSVLPIVLDNTWSSGNLSFFIKIP
jgi:hypothetical protein